MQKNILTKALLAAAVCVSSLDCSFAVAGENPTIPLSINLQPMCAIYRQGDNFGGVKNGPCIPDPPPAAGCPASISVNGNTYTLLRTSAVSYGVYPALRPSVNLLEADNIYGFSSTTGTVPTPFPWNSGSFPVIKQATRTTYLCEHFKTPAVFMSTTLSGSFHNSSASIGGANITMAISTAGGDFSAHLPSAGCLKNTIYGGTPNGGVPPDGSTEVFWNVNNTRPEVLCNLAPSTNYYINIIQSNPQQVTPACRAGVAACPVATSLTWGR